MNPPPSTAASGKVHKSVPQAEVAWVRDLALLCLLFGVLLGFRLGSYSLGNPDEGRYAEIPREMVAANDFTTPHLNGVNYFEKPPLVYWCVAGCLKLFGPSEWSMRTVPALFSLSGILLAYVAARRIYGRNAGIASAVVLGTSLLYFALSRILILDMAVSVLMSTSLFCFILGVREPAGQTRRWLFYGLYASAALATLSKGLIGVLIPGAVMFLWLLLLNQWQRLRPFYLPTGVLLFLTIALPWHLLAASHNETWTYRYFVYEHWLRFSSPVASRPGHWWYFIPIVLGGLFPWVGFLWPSLRARLSGGWAGRAENREAWFFVIWATFVFLFFSKSQSKLVPYILPVFPPLAVLIGSWLAETAAQTGAALRTGLRVFSFVCSLLAMAVLVVVLNIGHNNILNDPVQAQALRWPGIVLATILLIGGTLTPWVAAKHGPRSALTSMLVTMGLFFVTLTFAAPDIQKPGTKELALAVRARLQPGDRVMHYHEFFHDFTFYADQVVDVINYKGELELEEDAVARSSGRFPTDTEFRQLWAQPGRIYVIARKKDVVALKNGQPTGNLFGDQTFHYHLLAESPDHYLFSNQP